MRGVCSIESTRLCADTGDTVPLLDLSAVASRAYLVRHRCGFVGAAPDYSTVTVHRVCFPDVRVTGARLPRGVIAMCEAGIGRRTIYYNRAEPQSAQRVGIAHEFHHLLTDLKHPAEHDMRECNLGARALEAAGYLPNSPTEIACDLFAGELLVPFDVLDGYAPDVLFPDELPLQQAFEDEVDRLASRFNVPVPFMIWRLRDLQHLRLTSANLL